MEPFAIITDWHVHRDCSGSSFGTCEVRFPGEYSSLDFQRGFPLTRPTHNRCALYALSLGIEAVLGSNFINPDMDPVVFFTKSEWVAKSFESAKEWVKNPSRCPKGHREELVLFSKVVKSMKPLMEVRWLPRDDEEDPATIDLQLNPEDVEGDDEHKLKAVTRSKYAVRNVGQSGARWTRPIKKK